MANPSASPNLYNGFNLDDLDEFDRYCEAQADHQRDCERYGSRAKEPFFDPVTGQCRLPTCFKCRNNLPSPDLAYQLRALGAIPSIELDSNAAPAPPASSSNAAGKRKANQDSEILSSQPPPSSSAASKRKATNDSEGTSQTPRPTKKRKGKNTKLCDELECPGLPDCENCNILREMKGDDRKARSRPCYMKWPMRCNRYYCLKCGVEEAKYGPTTRNKRLQKERKEKTVVVQHNDRVYERGIARQVALEAETIQSVAPKLNPWVSGDDMVKVDVDSNPVLGDERIEELKKKGLIEKHYLTDSEEMFMMETKNRREEWLMLACKRLEAELHSRDFWRRNRSYEDADKEVDEDSDEGFVEDMPPLMRV